MKLISPIQLARRERLRRARWKFHLRRKELKRRRKLIPSEKVIAGAQPEVIQGARPIDVPRHFTLEDSNPEFIAWYEANANAVRRWLEKVLRRQEQSKKIKNSKDKFYNDFTRIESITPEAALLLAALYDRRLQLSGIPLRTYRYQEWKPAVRAVLQDIGFFDLLDMPEAEASETDGSGVDRSTLLQVARYESGDLVKPEHLHELIDNLLRILLAANPDCISTDEKTERTQKLFAALVEATENTRIHAYPDETRQNSTILPNWWLSGAANPEERKLTLIVYDQGISIPGSLASHRKSQWAGHNWVNRVVNRMLKGEFDQDDPISDHAKIRLAMKHTHSRTELTHRGKGLGVLREAIKHCQKGSLHIFSRKGEYIEVSGERPISRQLSGIMPGTLIIWELWL